MRRFMVLVTVGMLMAAMMVFAAPASAEAGCQRFGEVPLDEIQLEGIAGFVNVVTSGALDGGADDDVNALKAFYCGSG